MVSIRGLDLAGNFNKTDIHPILINSNSSYIHTGLERVPLEQAQPAGMHPAETARLGQV